MSNNLKVFAQVYIRRRGLRVARDKRHRGIVCPTYEL